MSRKFGQKSMIDNYEKFFLQICHKCKKEKEERGNYLCLEFENILNLKPLKILLNRVT